MSSLLRQGNFRVQEPDLLNLFQRNKSFKNHAIRLAESILAYISGTRFFQYRICAGTQQIINIFIIEQIQRKLMTKFFFKFKKTFFWPISPIFGAKKVFPKNQAVMHNFMRVSSSMAKFQRNLMMEFQENTLTDVRREGWTDPISQDPSSYHWGSNKYNCSRLAFKSQRQQVRF